MTEAAEPGSSCRVDHVDLIERRFIIANWTGQSTKRCSMKRKSITFVTAVSFGSARIKTPKMWSGTLIRNG
jgi:hypothetical protein